MRKRFLRFLFCGIIVIGRIHAQEVIVPHEKKPESLKQMVQPPEQIFSETPTPTPRPRKSKPREEKSAPARPTLEEMRTAGERAAEGSNDGSVSQPRKTRKQHVASAPAPNPTITETHRPVKQETPIEQKSPSRRSTSRSTNLEGIGPIRPTLIESGREAPSPSPAPR
jgi:hypothetical protein